MKNVGVLVVESNDLMRYAVCRLIDEQPGMKVVGEASAGKEALLLAAKHKPDMAVMDVKLPDMSGVDVTRRILMQLPGTRIIALSSYADEDLAISMFHTGALGYILKGASIEQIRQALRTVLNGDYYLSNEFGRRAIKKFLTSQPTTMVATAKRNGAELSERECTVMQLVADGLTSKEISSRLHISVETVNSHRKHARQKQR